MTETPVLEVSGLVKHYRAGSRFGGGRGTVRAVDGVDLTIGRGEILGLVGESGSGKSTVGKCVARLTRPTHGTIRLLGQDITQLGRAGMRPFRRDVHVVFQDPYSSLNPRMTLGQIVTEPLRQHGIGRGGAQVESALGMLERCGLNRELRDRYPHELSGGQRQRVALARALVLRPALVVADEPVSALDVSVQASILNLILDLQAEMGFSCLFITHDLSVVEFISDRIAVMYLGRIMETTSRADLFGDPQHPYTRSLLSAAPLADPGSTRERERERIILSGELPSPTAMIGGCVFHSRCPIAVEECTWVVPVLAGVTSDDHLTACHLVTADSGAPPIEPGGTPCVDHTP
ncbi:MAG: ABC transporter ATP-binding protein [Propionibacteriaceae bacterium]